MTNPDLQSQLTKLAIQASDTCPQTEAFLDGLAKESALYLEQEAIANQAFLNRAAYEIVKTAQAYNIPSDSQDLRILLEKVAAMTHPDELQAEFEKSSQLIVNSMRENLVKEGFDEAFIDGMVKQAECELVKISAGLAGAPGLLRGGARLLGNLFERPGSVAGLTKDVLLAPVGSGAATQAWHGITGNKGALAEHAMQTRNLTRDAANQAGTGVHDYANELMPASASHTQAGKGPLFRPDSPELNNLDELTMARGNVSGIRANNTPGNKYYDRQQAYEAGTKGNLMRNVGNEFADETAAFGQKWMTQGKPQGVDVSANTDFKAELAALHAKGMELHGSGAYPLGPGSGPKGPLSYIEDLQRETANGLPMNDNARGLLDTLAKRPEPVQLRAGHIAGTPQNIAPGAQAARQFNRGGINPTPFMHGRAGIASAVTGLATAPLGPWVSGPVAAATYGAVGKYGLLKPTLLAGAGLTGLAGVGAAAGGYGLYKGMAHDNKTTDSTGELVDRNRLMPFANNGLTGGVGGALLAAMIAREMGIDGWPGLLLPLLGGYMGHKMLPGLMNKWQDADGRGANMVPHSQQNINQQYQQAYGQ